MRWLGWAIVGLAAVPAAFAAYFRRQGDADVRFDPNRLELLEAERSPDRLRIRYRLPVANHGRQKGMLYEILARPEYLDRWMGDLRFAVAVFRPGVQETGYWAATLMKPGEIIPLEFEVTVCGRPDALDRLLGRDALALVMRHGVIGRTPLRWHLTEVRIPMAAVRERIATAAGEGGRAGATGVGGLQVEEPQAAAPPDGIHHRPGGGSRPRVAIVAAGSTWRGGDGR